MPADGTLPGEARVIAAADRVLSRERRGIRAVPVFARRAITMIPALVLIGVGSARPARWS